MSEQPGSGRLDADTIAAYLDGQLPPEARALVEARLAADPETYEWVVNAVQTREELEFVETESAIAAGGGSPPRDPEWAEVLGAGARRSAPVVELSVPGARPNLRQRTQRVLPFYKRGSVKAAIGAALMAAAALVLLVRLAPERTGSLRALFSLGGSDVDPRFEKLVAAVGEERYIEGRLTGGFKYGPLRSVTRGPGDLSNQNLALLAAAGELQKAAQADPSAENLHAWGVAQLLLGDLDNAIADLEDAVAQHPNATLLVDLSAAYLARASLAEHQDDLTRALSLSERVIGDAPTASPALFNRALALEKLSLTEQAKSAWRLALQHETRDEWRTHIENHLKELEAEPSPRDLQSSSFERLGDPSLAPSAWAEIIARVAKSYPRATREWIEDIALGEWGSRALAGDPTASTWLNRARLAAAQLSGNHQDASLQQQLRAIDSAEGAGRTDLAEAHWKFSQARRLYQALRMSDATPLLQGAMGKSLGSPALSTNTAIHLAIVRYYERDLVGSRADLIALEQKARMAGFGAYHARINWMLGIIDGAQARYSASLARYEVALAAYESLGELDYAATMRHLIADALGNLGELPQAWSHLLRALSYWKGDWNPRRQYGSLMTASVLSRRGGAVESVFWFQSAAADAAQHWGDATALIQSRLELARSLSAAGRGDTARKEVANAREALSGVADHGRRTTIEAQVLRVDALVESADNPLSAVESLRKAADVYGSAGSSLQLVEIHLAAVRALRKSKRNEEAAALARDGLSLLDRHREQIQQADARVSFMNAVWDLYAEAVELSLEGANTEAAFALAEHGRARTLLEGGSSNEAITPAVLQQRLAPGDAVLYYVRLPSAWAVWAISRDRVSLWKDHSTTLSELTLRLRRSIAARDGQTWNEARLDLSRVLIHPVEQALLGVRRLLICGDGEIFAVPFAALSKSNGRMLVEETTIAWLPAARAYQARNATPALARQAAVFAPGLVSVPSLRLRPLPAATTEAKAIAALYGIEANVGSDANVHTFALALDRADVVHFAGHAISAPSAPVAMRLVFASTATESIENQLVTAAQLEAMTVKNGSTIVLAACASAAGSVLRGEGAMTLARPFLARGAGAVVGALWEIDDAGAGELFIPLHKALKEGLPVEEALARAQRLVLKKLDPHTFSDWAALVVATGTVEPWASS